MSINLARRIKKIKEKLDKNPPDLLDMTDDELVQVITSDPNAKSSDFTTEQLEVVIRKAKR